jgi:uncharacterized membrane protein
MPSKEWESAVMVMALVAFAVLVCLAVCALLMWLVNLTVIRLQPGELKHHWGPVAYVLPKEPPGYHIEPSSGAGDKAMHRQGSTLQLNDAPHTAHCATALNHHHGMEDFPMTKVSQDRTRSTSVTRAFTRSGTIALAVGFLLTKSRVLMWTAASCLFTVLAIPAGLAAQDGPDHQPAIVTFDVPGAGTGAYQGTSPSAINPKGEVTGLYIDANNVLHGFVWKCDRERSGEDCKECKGVSTSFDPQGSALTLAFGINGEGEVAGEYYDGSFLSHGFLRDRDGTITTFLAPDLMNTYVSSINAEGEITGNYFGDDPSVTSFEPGFLRARDGTITTFNPQGSEYTFANSINAKGEIAGEFQDANNVYHGFMRTRDGNFVTFEAPGAGTSAYHGTLAGSINPDGVIVGNYVDANGLSHGYLRASDGAITTFEAPGSVNGTYLGLPQSIDAEGTITGYSYDANHASHGFVRSRDGRFTTFDAPGAGTGAYQGTFAYSINPEGLIAGYYIDANNVSHGFVREGDREGQFHSR